MATEDDNPNSGLIGTVTAAGAISMIAICAVVTALVRSEQADEDVRKNAFANEKPVAELRAEQQKALSASPTWVDQAKGRIGIPIDRAMGAVVKDLKENPESATPPSDQPAAVDAGADGASDAGDAGAAEVDADAGAATDAGAEPKEPKKPAPLPKKQGGGGTVPPPGEGAGN